MSTIIECKMKFIIPKHFFFLNKPLDHRWEQVKCKLVRLTITEIVLMFAIKLFTLFYRLKCGLTPSLSHSLFFVYFSIIQRIRFIYLYQARNKMKKVKDTGLNDKFYYSSGVTYSSQHECIDRFYA